MGDGNNIQSNYPKTEEIAHLEIRREAVGSDRRDESVMGPPPTSFSLGSLHTNNQREIPTGEDAPVSLQSSTMSTALAHVDGHGASVQDNDENRMEEVSSAAQQHGANVSSNNTSNARPKGQRYKSKKEIDDKDSDKRTTKKQGKGGRRSSTPEAYVRDSGRQRHRSPPSFATSSSNEVRSSDESDSEERYVIFTTLCSARSGGPAPRG